MQARIRHLWETAIGSYWLLPGGMLVGAGFMSEVALAADRFLEGKRPGWTYVGNADGAMTVLSTIASSTITVAGVVFSITIAALTQASSQFGPRLLRNFMRDRGNQIVLGTFVATFLYCLLILRTIQVASGDGEAFVPRGSVTGAVVLAGASIGVLIYFIHHVSLSLQAPTLIAAVRADLTRAIDRLPHRDDGASAPRPSRGDGPVPLEDLRAAPPARAVRAVGDGYIVAIDYDVVIGIAAEADVFVRLFCRPGGYVVRGSTLALVSREPHPTDGLDARITGAIVLGHQATDEQDPEYPMRQLVEIAVRALSPGINDPFTAEGCVDALGSGLCELMLHPLPRPLHHDESGALRVVAAVPDFGSFVDTAFDAIRRSAGGQVQVLERLLIILRECAAQAANDDQREALRRHIELVMREAERCVSEPLDLAAVRERHASALEALADTLALRTAA